MAAQRVCWLLVVLIICFDIIPATFCQPAAKIDRKALIARFNPTRLSSQMTPLQTGNGNFAFSTDITSLQTFYPFAIMSSWGFKNDSYPFNRTREDIEEYKGVSWWNNKGKHVCWRLVQYDFGGPPDIETWLRGNPNRVNLGRVGLLFFSPFRKQEPQTPLNITESDLVDSIQTLDLYTGKLSSQFSVLGQKVKVSTTSDLYSDTIAIDIQSALVEEGRIGLFLDYPWNEGKEKFAAPYVGYWDLPEKHTTTLSFSSSNSNSKPDPNPDANEVKVDSTVEPKLARIAHRLDEATFYTYLSSPLSQPFSINRDSPFSHRYTILPLRAKEMTPSKSPNGTFSISIQYSDSAYTHSIPLPNTISTSANKGWESYWTESGFVDVLTGSKDKRAEELQRRIILSRYLLRVNGAGDTPAQESGLVNNGWFGKFHMEIYFWHNAHWALWNNWSILNRSSSIYSRVLSTAITLARVQQGFSKGARWPKMTDPSGRSSPGELNNLLIWQQPHPIVFALYEYRAFPTRNTLLKWKDVVKETADWMADFASFNKTTGRYDLGPPLHVVSEDTHPNATINPAFELAYWKFALQEAERWVEKLGEPVPADWTKVRRGLAPLPMDNGLYAIYEGVDGSFWTDEKYTSDHPALVGLHGWLPPTEGLDLGVAKRTAEKVWDHWNITNCWGWDFPMLAMSAARNGDTEKAIDWLLHPLFEFDDAGMPIGGTRVPTPYFPGSGSLLYAIAMLAEGWEGSQSPSPGFPKEGWNVRVEGLSRAL